MFPVMTDALRRPGMGSLTRLSRGVNGQDGMARRVRYPARTWLRPVSFPAADGANAPGGTECASSC